MGGVKLIDNEHSASGDGQCTSDKEHKFPSTTSLTIDALRFPLAIAVIFIHMCPAVVNLPEAQFSLLSGEGILNVIGILFSHSFTRIAVPTFYIISGYLFFVNMRKWSWGAYRSKIHSRWYSLCIPYLAWNICLWIFAIVAYAAVGGIIEHDFSRLINYLSTHQINILIDINQWGFDRLDWLGGSNYRTGPLDLPLWFLRDLIVMCLLAPVIYWVVRKLRGYGLALLGIAYISHIWTSFPGLSITAFFFFTLGATFAIRGVDIVAWARRYRWVILPAAVITLVPATIFDAFATRVGYIIYPFWIISGTLSAFIIADVFVRRFGYVPSKKLVAACFFVYAFHWAHFVGVHSPLDRCKQLIHLLIPGKSLAEEYVCYLLTPFLTAAFCVITFQLGMRFMPKLMKLFGGR